MVPKCEGQETSQRIRSQLIMLIVSTKWGRWVGVHIVCVKAFGVRDDPWGWM